MKAMVLNGYGSVDFLKLKEVEKPKVKENDVLVRVIASSVNAGDFFSMMGSPWVVRFAVGFPKPKDHILGWDVAGCVETAGTKVKRFRPGDEVFASCSGAFAEYVSVDAGKLASKPVNLSFEQAAAVPTGAITALQCLRDGGQLQKGQQVLINGASGGVGSFAVQIAKSFGAEVTGVCSTKNIDMVRSIGADQVIDHTREDFTNSRQRYDLILDNVANRRFSDLRRALAPDGIIIPNSGHGGMGYVIKAFLLSLLMHQQGSMIASRPNTEDLDILKDLIESRKITPVIDRTYTLQETQKAIEYVGQGHTKGKVVITVDPEGKRE